jgi:hypothetical protein
MQRIRKRNNQSWQTIFQGVYSAPCLRTEQDVKRLLTEIAPLGVVIGERIRNDDDDRAKGERIVGLGGCQVHQLTIPLTAEGNDVAELLWVSLLPLREQVRDLERDGRWWMLFVVRVPMIEIPIKAMGQAVELLDSGFGCSQTMQPAFASIPRDERFDERFFNRIPSHYCTPQQFNKQAAQRPGAELPPGAPETS